jgi:choloylglycine hydrolase
MLKKITILLTIILIVISIKTSLFACSRILWKTQPATVSARTMDLYISDEPAMVVYPGGIEKDGKAGDNSLKWKSTYGSVVITGFHNGGTDDGINEKGFAAHLLYLHGTEYEKRDNRPGVGNSMVVQYFLDNFSTVEEAVKSLDKFQVISAKIKDREWPVHFAIEDVTGDSAIIEYIKGKIVVHHGPEYKVMTNEPAYDLQLENLKKYKLFGGNLPMPGDIDSISRFVRASSYLKTLPEPKNEIDAAAYILGVIRTTAAAFGAKDTSGNEGGDAWPTRWITVMDMTNLVYYFSATTGPNIFWVELKNLNLAEGAPVLTLDPHNLKLNGEVSKDFYHFSE